MSSKSAYYIGVGSMNHLQTRDKKINYSFSWCTTINKNNSRKFLLYSYFYDAFSLSANILYQSDKSTKLAASRQFLKKKCPVRVTFEFRLNRLMFCLSSRRRCIWMTLWFLSLPYCSSQQRSSLERERFSWTVAVWVYLYKDRTMLWSEIFSHCDFYPLLCRWCICGWGSAVTRRSYAMC